MWGSRLYQPLVEEELESHALVIYMKQENLVGLTLKKYY